MAKRYMLTYSTSPVIREMQIKTTIYHLISVKMSIIKKTRDDKLVRMWRKGTLDKNTPTVGRNCILVQPLWKTVWRFLKKLKIELSTTQSSSHTSGYISEVNKINISKRHLYFHVQQPKYGNK